ncbi:site-specific integrase [Micromonospora sp. WMMD1082]|uniref:tyrosine-type recombinase/integrase n=1 Tax=Micromonospora sp. WMMD1082 TaxID=3016104 RepID=UPI0024172EE7|nr:site-specific integrase [Micromonospora sp. WMMD1082]MDG4795076.1 tyrosine-type recombinase/integrase [Micromonospora sp. WMMD1082]
MSTQSVFKRCSCRDRDGRKLGTRCPNLRRPGGAWNPTHGRWAYQLELPTHPGQRRRQLRRSTFDTRDAATAEREHARALLALASDEPTVAVEIADMLLSVLSGTPLPDRDTIARRVRAGLPATVTTTVGEYLRSWLTSRRNLQSVQPSTLIANESHIDVHLTPHLGAIPLVKLRVEHIEAMFTAIADRNTAIDIARQSDDPAIRASVRGLRTTGPATMHRIRATLRKALNDAIRRSNNRLMDFNPAAHINLPSGVRPKARVWTAKAVQRWRDTGERPSPVMVWTPQQAGEFLDYAEYHDIVLYPLFTLILHRALRRGEAVGLPDTAVDLDNLILSVTQQMATHGYTPVIKNVKSDSGNRVMALAEPTGAVLRAHHARRARWKLACGAAWPDTGLFFVQPDGQPWHPNTVTDRFEALVHAAGLPPIRLHDLRHCAATYLKAAGADLKDIQELLGHSSAAMTDVYTSVIVELDVERAKAEAAAKLLPRHRRGQRPAA